MNGSSEFWSAIAGAVVGTLGSGAISWILQRQQFIAAKTERQQEQLRRQQALANALLFKLLRIASNCDQISKHIEELFSQHSEAPWQFLLPIVNMPEHIYFTPDEMGMLISLGDDNIFNRAVDLDVAHNALLQAVAEAFRKRQELVGQLPPVTVSGLSAESVFQADSSLILEMNVVNNLALQVRERAASEAAISSILLQDVNKLFGEKLDLKRELRPKQQ